MLLERILEELGLNTLFSAYKGFTKLEYDVYGFAKLLIFGRFLDLVSKSATMRQNNDYYEPILGSHNPDNVFDTLDFIYENRDRNIQRMNTNLVKNSSRSPQIIYYDVINFYFEIEQPDDDVMDRDGTVLEKGQRKMGVCKDEQKLSVSWSSFFVTLAWNYPVFMFLFSNGVI